MCRKNCGRNCHRLNLHRRHDRRHHSRRAPAKACQIVNQRYFFLFFHVVLLFFSGCLRICFMSIFAHSRLIYKFFPDKKKRGCREIDRPVCKLSYVKSQNILLFILVKFTTCFCEKCTKRGISIYADWKCLFFCSLVSFFSSAQEVFNNDVFRLRFRHAERSEFQ